MVAKFEINLYIYVFSCMRLDGEMLCLECEFCIYVSACMIKKEELISLGRLQYLSNLLPDQYMFIA